MAAITVTPAADGTYSVDVDESGSSSHHVVTVGPDARTGFGAGVSGEELVAAAFRFLLDREPKESILSRFDLTVISRYFPEFPDRIEEYL